ncbi:MAG: hypothetical protein ABFD08_13135 [Syntrophomonas sp.]
MIRHTSPHSPDSLSETFEKLLKATFFVIPAKAGIQLLLNSSWIPGQARNDE